MTAHHRVVLHAALIAAALSTVVASNLERERQATIAAENAKAQNLGRALEEHARQTLNRIDLTLSQALEVARRAGDPAKADAADLRARLRALLPADGLVRVFGVADRGGFFVVHTLSDAPFPTNAAALTFFTVPRDLSGDGMHLSATMRGPVTGKWMFPASRRISAADGSFLGVLVAAIDTESFQAFYDTIDTGRNGFVGLFLRDGGVLARSPFDEEIAGRADAPLFGEYLTEGAGTVRQVASATGIESLFSYRTLKDYPVVVSLGVSLNDSLAGWRQRAWRDSAGLLVVLAALAWATRRLVRQQAQEDATRRSLQQSEGRLSLFAQYAPAALAMFDRDQRYVVASRRWLDDYGLDERELRGGARSSALPEMPEAWKRIHRRGVAGEVLHSEGDRFERADGSVQWVRWESRPWHDAVGAVAGNVIFSEDITASVEAREALRESEERFAAFMNNSPAIAFVKDAAGRLRYINPTFERAFEFKDREWHGKTDFELWDGETARQMHSTDLAILSSGEPLPVEETVRQRDGEHQWIIFKFPFRDRQGRLYLGGMGIDITERKEAEARAQYLAFHDLLTGLPNRRLALDRLTGILAQAEREQREAAIMFVDLDRFKDINDSVGHALGDQLLQQVAARMRPVLREGDTVARLGGDEFLVLLPHIGAPEDAAQVAQKLIDTLRNAFVLDSHELHVGASVGIGLYPRDGTDGETLIQHADAALYHSKNSGRNQFQFFDRSMDTRARERLALTNLLRRTLERDEVEVFYQPQIDALSGAVIGVEALARWNHPDRGYVSPGVFIPIAEESGLIVPLGQSVLRQACAAAVASRRAGLGSPRMAVNLSERQLRHPDLVDDVATILTGCGLAPSDLELELTESSVLGDAGVGAGRLAQLADLGVRLALDDFGTGYSSLAYLKRFRIDSLKIDRSFLENLPGDLENAAIVRAIVAMARALDLDFVAEGVEREAQRDFLLGEGCRHMQGDLFCRPLPLDEWLAWLRDRDGAKIVPLALFDLDRPATVLTATRPQK